ncbi:DUF302 domain-containing protein [Pelagibius sp. Alg239-R121]|uniref:DUF302 domain-containing protein n=1 Tax=Pelagibius sp. Alg239-R121 TaxID=2993448 RepID=UPI0024A667B7|nr:DUF302 domain-containing protein [Pelagibius sp. Alg239-R121]
MHRLFLTIAFSLGLITSASLTALAENGTIVKESNRSVSETITLLEETLKSKGITIFARIDHAAGASKVDQSLRPTELLIFGNPKLGTPLMQSNQAVGVDLPLKALAYEDEAGKVYLVYNDPKYLSERHDLGEKAKVIEKISGALSKFSDIATK